MLFYYYMPFNDHFLDLYMTFIITGLFILLEIPIAKRYLLKRKPITLFLLLMYLCLIGTTFSGGLGFLFWYLSGNVNDAYRWTVGVTICFTMGANLMIFFFSELIFSNITESPTRKWVAAAFTALSVVCIILLADMPANNYLGYDGTDTFPLRRWIAQGIWLIAILLINLQALTRFILLKKKLGKTDQSQAGIRSIICVFFFQILALIFLGLDTINSISHTIPVLTDFVFLMELALLFSSVFAYRGFILQK
jgi:hypothetical protein